MKINILYFILGVAIIATSCQTEKRYDLRDYYFPIGKIDTNDLRYEYQSMRDDSLSPYTLLVTKTVKNGKTLLLTTREEEGRISQKIEEELVTNGTVCTKYTFYQPDSTGKTQEIKANINAQATTFFPFDVREKGGVYPFELTFASPDKATDTYTITKNRLFMGFKDYYWSGDNKTHRCAEFLTKTRILLSSTIDGSIAPETLSNEYYAKAIGLIYVQTTVGKDKITEFGLKARRKN